MHSYITILEKHFLSFQILVKIESAGVNPVDTYIREGAYLNLPDLPFIPGKDGAGVIQKIGEDVKTFQVYCVFVFTNTFMQCNLDLSQFFDS